nr:hypothetical protein MmNV_35 [Menippe mercenaria nudivirus]
MLTLPVPVFQNMISKNIKIEEGMEMYHLDTPNPDNYSETTNNDKQNESSDSLLEFAKVADVEAFWSQVSTRESDNLVSDNEEYCINIVSNDDHTYVSYKDLDLYCTSATTDDELTHCNIRRRIPPHSNNVKLIVFSFVTLLLLILYYVSQIITTQTRVMRG